MPRCGDPWCSPTCAADSHPDPPYYRGNPDREPDYADMQARRVERGSEEGDLNAYENRHDAPFWR